MLVRSEPNSIYPLITSDLTAPLVNAVFLKNRHAVLLNHRHAVLIRDLPGLDLSVSWATGSFIAMNIGDLVLEQREVSLDVGVLPKQR